MTLNSDGSYSYDVSGNAATIALANGATATDTFSYKVKDDETNAGSKALDIGIITFTITGIDEGVTANNDSITFLLHKALKQSLMVMQKMLRVMTAIMEMEIHLQSLIFATRSKRRIWFNKCCWQHCFRRLWYS